MTSPSWPVRVRPGSPGMALASTNKMSPPAPVTAKPAATPGVAVRSPSSSRSIDLPSHGSSSSSVITTGWRFDLGPPWRPPCEAAWRAFARGRVRLPLGSSLGRHARRSPRRSPRRPPTIPFDAATAGGDVGQRSSFSHRRCSRQPASVGSFSEKQSVPVAHLHSASCLARENNAERVANLANFQIQHDVEPILWSCYKSYNVRATNATISEPNAHLGRLVSARVDVDQWDIAQPPARPGYPCRPISHPLRAWPFLGSRCHSSLAPYLDRSLRKRGRRVTPISTSGDTGHRPVRCAGVSTGLD